MKFERILILGWAMFVVAMLPGCGQVEECVPVPADNAMRLTAGYPSDEPGTRAKGNTWMPGDRIGVTVIGGLVSYFHVPYSLTSTTGTQLGAFLYDGDDVSTRIELTDNNVYNIHAIYPFNSGSQGSRDVIIDVDCDSNPDDILYAELKNHPGTKKDVSLTFEHQLSKVVVVVTTDDYTFGSMSDVVLNGFYTKGTYRFRGANEGVVRTGNPQRGVPWSEWKVSGTSRSMRIERLLPPQPGGEREISISSMNPNFQGGTTFDMPALEAGKVYTLNVKVNPNVLEITGTQITDWKDKGTTSAGNVWFK